MPGNIKACADGTVRACPDGRIFAGCDGPECPYFTLSGSPSPLAFTLNLVKYTNGIPEVDESDNIVYYGPPYSHIPILQDFYDYYFGTTLDLSSFPEANCEDSTLFSAGRIKGPLQLTNSHDTETLVYGHLGYGIIPGSLGGYPYGYFQLRLKDNPVTLPPEGTKDVYAEVIAFADPATAYHGLFTSGYDRQLYLYNQAAIDGECPATWPLRLNVTKTNLAEVVPGRVAISHTMNGSSTTDLAVEEYFKFSHYTWESSDTRVRWFYTRDTSYDHTAFDARVENTTFSMYYFFRGASKGQSAGIYSYRVKPVSGGFHNHNVNLKAEPGHFDLDEDRGVIVGMGASPGANTGTTNYVTAAFSPCAGVNIIPARKRIGRAGFSGMLIMQTSSGSEFRGVSFEAPMSFYYPSAGGLGGEAYTSPTHPAYGDLGLQIYWSYTKDAGQFKWGAIAYKAALVSFMRYIEAMRTPSHGPLAVNSNLFDPGNAQHWPVGSMYLSRVTFFEGVNVTEYLNIECS